MKRSFTPYLNDILTNEFPETRHFFFAEGKYTPNIGLVEIPLINFEGIRNTLNIPAKTDITIWSLKCPYERKSHAASLLKYSADVRNAPAFEKKNLEIYNIQMFNTFQLSAYTPPKNGEGSFKTVFNVSKQLNFKLQQDLITPYLTSVHYLDADNITWKTKNVLDLNRAITDSKVQFLVERTNNIFEKGNQTMIAITNKDLYNYNPTIEFHMNTPSNSQNLYEEIKPKFDMFVPETVAPHSHSKFKKINLFDHFWPEESYQRGGERFHKGIKDYDTHRNFLADLITYLENKNTPFECLFSTKDRVNTNANYLFHFKNASINVKAGSFYVTKEHFEMMQTSLFYTEYSTKGNIKHFEQDIDSIASQMSPINKDQKTTMIAYLRGNDKTRTKLVKIMIAKSFIFYHISVLSPQASKLNRMFSYEIGTPGEMIDYKKKIISNLERKRYLVSSGKLIKSENLKVLNLFEDDGKGMAMDLETDLVEFYKDNWKRDKVFRDPIYPEVLTFPNFIYKLHLKPSALDVDSFSEVFYVYNQEANRWSIPNLNTEVNMSGICLFNARSKNAHVYNNTPYFNLIDFTNRHNWTNQLKKNIKNFDMSLFNSFGDPFPSVTSNGKIKGFKDIGISINEENRAKSMEIFESHAPAIREYIFILNAQSQEDNINYRIESDKYMKDLINQYPLRKNRYILSLESAVLPTKFKDNRNCSFVFIKVVGLERATDLILNGNYHQILGTINLDSEGDAWKGELANETNYAFSFGSTVLQSKHPHYKLEIKSLSEIKSFTLSLINQSGQQVSFQNETQLRPQYTLKIQVHEKL